MDSDVRWFIGSNSAAWIVFSVAVLCSSKRYSIQSSKHGQLLLEDYIHVAAVIQLVAFLLLAQVWLTTSLLDDYTEADAVLETLFNSQTAFFCLYFNTIFTSKAVFLAFYRRVFGVSRTFRFYWWAAALLTAVAFIIGIIVEFWACFGKPSLYKWTCDFESWTGYNAYETNSAIASLVCNSTTDIILMVLPLAMLYKIQMSRGKKLKIIPIFLLTAFTVVIDILSWVFLIYNFSNDASNASVLFLTLEPSITVIIAAMPALLFAKKSARSLRDREEIKASQNKPSLSRNRWLLLGRHRRRATEISDMSSSGLWGSSHPTVGENVTITKPDGQIHLNQGVA